MIVDLDGDRYLDVLAVWSEELESFDSAGSTAHYRGRLRLDDGAHAYFATIALKDLRGEVGEYGAIEGGKPSKVSRPSVSIPIRKPGGVGKGGEGGKSTKLALE